MFLSLQGYTGLASQGEALLGDVSPVEIRCISLVYLLLAVARRGRDVVAQYTWRQLRTFCIVLGARSFLSTLFGSLIISLTRVYVTGSVIGDISYLRVGAA